MILINNNWESTGSLQDISKIIREYYNYELADVLDGLIIEQKEDLLEENFCLKLEVDRLKEKIDYLEQELEEYGYDSDDELGLYCE